MRTSPFQGFFILLSESSSGVLKEETERESPVGLDDVEILVGEPAPAEFAVACDGGVVRVASGELSAAIVDDRVYPNELAVGVHLRDIFVTAKLTVLVVKQNLRADVVDISALEHFVQTLVLLDDGKVSDLGRVGLDDVEKSLGGSGLYDDLVSHIVLADEIGDLFGVIPELVNVDKATVLVSLKDLVERADAPLCRSAVVVYVAKLADLFVVKLG